MLLDFSASVGAIWRQDPMSPRPAGAVGLHPYGRTGQRGAVATKLHLRLCRPPVIRRIATVGGLTLVSRVMGFVRDAIMAAVLGAGPVADAFFVAFRLPNHFRAILAEGAFNAAFVPAYARTLEQSGLPAARLFSDRIAAALLVINLILLGLALVFTPSVVSLLAPGLDQDPARYDLAVTLTRVTFPALLLVSMQTMISGELNANGRFAAAAGAPILLNICMVVTLSVAYWFPNAGLAAACLGDRTIPHALARMPRFREETMLALLILLGGAIYAAVVLLLLGRNWPHDLLRNVGAAADCASPSNPSPLSHQAGVTANTAPASGEDIRERV